MNKQNKDNEVILQPMNPQQRSMSEDTITKNYFPRDGVSHDFYSTGVFVDILKT